MLTGSLFTRLESGSSEIQIPNGWLPRSRAPFEAA